MLVHKIVFNKLFNGMSPKNTSDVLIFVSTIFREFCLIYFLVDSQIKIFAN